MDGARLFDLALYVDNFALTEAGGGADAGGGAEGVIAQGDDGQAVDLTQLGTLGVDEEGAAQYLLMQALAQLPQAPAAMAPSTCSSPMRSRRSRRAR